MESSGGHMVVNLELVGEWENNEVIYLIEKEDDVKSEKAIKRIHRNLYIYFNYCIRVNSTETIRDTYVVAPGTS